MTKKFVECEITCENVEIRKLYLLKQNVLILTEIYLLRQKTLFTVTLLHVKNVKNVTVCPFLKKKQMLKNLILLKD